MERVRRLCCSLILKLSILIFTLNKRLSLLQKRTGGDDRPHFGGVGPPSLSNASFKYSSISSNTLDMSLVELSSQIGYTHQHIISNEFNSISLLHLRAYVVFDFYTLPVISPVRNSYLHRPIHSYAPQNCQQKGDYKLFSFPFQMQVEMKLFSHNK